MEYPRCTMKVGAVDFPESGDTESQCTLEGRHYHDKWPDKPICCGHLDAADAMIKLLDFIGAENRKNWFKGSSSRPTIVNLRVLGEP